MVEELLPATVTLVAQVDVNEWMRMRLTQIASIVIAGVLVIEDAAGCSKNIRIFTG